ncbi:MAG TPA: DUF5522 domain-containing protein [Acidobacteriaceae bacterium]|nr:DUF5522 domain-containing protein [Acidobacteriaceae bacterium]
MPDSAPDPAPDPAPRPDARERPLIEGEDFYREGPYVVFTEAYHRRRGSCCGSGCRHCPWRSSAAPGAQIPTTGERR